MHLQKLRYGDGETLVMKFVLLLFIGCFLGLESKSQTYTYIPFPDSNMVWKGSSVCVIGPGDSDTRNWEFSMQGDTIISGNVYSRIKTPRSPKYFIREDSAKRIYFIKSSTGGSEKLLIDFSKQTGDTCFSGNDFTEILSVDTPLYVGRPRRTLHTRTHALGTIFNDRWIEGLGSTKSPIGYYGENEYHICSGPDNDYLCNIAVDGVYELSYCGVSSINEAFGSKILVYPNPAINIITVESDRLQYLKEARIYNSVGLLIANIKANTSETKLTVPVDFWPTGFYILNLVFKDSTEKSIRFVKSN